jgi:histidinol-phosphate aminotransferase
MTCAADSGKEPTLPDFVRTNVRAMHGYAPGEQPGAGERVVKLNTNENPFPPSPKVLQAIREVEAEHLRKYPDPVAQPFRVAAAKLWGLTPEHFITGNGSDDILTIATRTFVPPGGLLAYPSPTYSLYPVLAAIESAKVVAVPWERGFELPLEGLLESGAQAIYLANPNAPTGTVVKPQTVSKLAEKFDGLVLVDEAYADFAEDNCVSLVGKHANVMISRSLSKAYSLAGLRFGYGIAQAQVIEQLMKVKDSYNCDALSIVAAVAAIEDQEYARGCWEMVKAERQRVTEELSAIGCAVLPSQGNFVLAGVPGGNGKAAYLGLKAKGILVRYFDLPGLTDKIRITIGTANENNALIAGLASLVSSEKAA